MQQPCNGVYKRLKTQGLFRHDGQKDRRLSREGVPGSGIVGIGRLQTFSRDVVGERSCEIPDPDRCSVLGVDCERGLVYTTYTSRSEPFPCATVEAGQGCPIFQDVARQRRASKNCSTE